MVSDDYYPSKKSDVFCEEICGQDEDGIVAKISESIASRGGNIINAELSSTSPPPFSKYTCSSPVAPPTSPQFHSPSIPPPPTCPVKLHGLELLLGKSLQPIKLHSLELLFGKRIQLRPPSFELLLGKRLHLRPPRKNGGQLSNQHSKSQIRYPRLEVSKLGFDCLGLSGILNAPLSHEDGCSILKDAFNKGFNLKWHNFRKRELLLQVT